MIALYIAIPVAVLLGLWLFLIAPGSSRGMEKFKSVRYAHRGLHGDFGEGYAAENSLTAFDRAASRGFGIELDVHVTSDGEVVVFHDDTLTRVTGAEGRIKDKTLSELRCLRLSGTEDTIPTLTEVLRVVDKRVPLLIEIKEGGFDHTISERTAEVLRDYDGEFIVESFSPLAFGAIRRTLKGIPCGFLCDKLTANEQYRSIKYRLIQRQLLNVIARPAFIAMNKSTHKLFPMPIVRALFRTPMLAWTVKSEAEEREAYKNGFSGIIFEGYIPTSGAEAEK
ncbi:MAG: hypothetical protein IKD45_02005 [Clostridia bacterium]|nr:hypothetical protein [Clostridia bacterium]